MEHQDWEEVTLRSVKKARLHEPGASTPVRYTMQAIDARKIENTEVAKVKKLTAKSRTDMAAARTAKNLTQKQLDMRCAFPANTINAFESGRQCPSRVHIQNIQRTLGIKLELE